MDDLINALKNASLYPHETTEFQVIETHISWVLLTGPFAYKIKKPVNFGFIDYTTLEKRKYYSDLELTLNQRLARPLYEGVIPIRGSRTNPALEGKEPIIEYALKMHQFEQNRLLSHVHETEGLSKAIVHDLSKQIADFHQDIEVSKQDSPYGTLDHVLTPVLDNFTALKNLKAGKAWLKDLAVLEAWANDQFQALKETLSKRKTNGFIRACHGDLRLSNIVLYHGKPMIFDCIEFNEDFRQIDVVADIAFLIMDLEHKNHHALAHSLANHYFELTGDYQGLTLLNFYKAYRAMVWAKISAIQAEPLAPHDPEARLYLKNLEAYLKLALSYQIQPKPQLTITFGPSGCGKTTFTNQWILDNQAFRIRSDVVRKQMFQMKLDEPPEPDQKAKLYSENTTKQVYQTLCDEAHFLLKHQIPVLIDATCLKKWQRELFLSLAHEHGVLFKILSFDYDEEQCRKRLLERQKHQDVSDADVAVFEKQISTLEPLSDIEKTYTQNIVI